MRLGRRREESLSSSDDNTISDQDNEPHYEYILKEMHVPSLSDNLFAGQKDLVDLVFVHGLGGNLRTTWKQEGTTEPWFTKPEFLGRLQDSVRVLSFGYNAHRFGDVANTRIIHHANDLLRNLVLKRLDHPDRPLIFIAHSLDLKAILLCATNDDWKAIKQATKSIIFMGTPHMGSEKAEDLVVVQKLASLMKLQTAVATNLTKELRAFSNSVQDINMEFTIDVHRSIKLLCCYESHPQRLPNGAKEIIVPQWSAVLQGVDNIDLNCTHSGLPKFASPLHPRFELFWGEVERLVRLAEPPPIKPLKKAPTWTDEDVAQPSPRPRPRAPLRRRHEVGKASKASRDSAIRSSVDKLLKEVTSRINVDLPIQHETAVSQAQNRTQPEKFDVKEFSDFTRLLRSVTPENKGLDREAPHWQTCSWILEDPTFVKWKENKSGSLLFITGSPGCGKSNLAKYIQGAMKDSNDERWEESLVIPFYCDSLESSRHNPPILDLVVQSMLSKYTTMSQGTRKKLESVLETLGVDRQKSRSPLETENSGHFVQLMEIVQLLVTAEDARPTCLIIDGLDQCEDEFIIRLLRGLDTIFRRESSASALKVVVTSRMADSIRGFALANNHIEVTPDLILNDIQKVVDEEVDRIILSRRIATVGRASVSAVIVERSNGSFLFASAVLKELWHIKDTGANSVFTLVTSCPPTMEAIYQQDMDRIQNERNDLFQLIQIICIARSTLRIEEAKEILRFLNPSVTRTYDLVGDLTRTCQRLIRFGAEDTVELLHQTLYDFILDTYDVNLVHQTLATACLKYVREIDWEPYYDPWTDYCRDALADHYVFLEYTSAWFRYHLKFFGPDTYKISGDLWDFIRSPAGEKWRYYTFQRQRTWGSRSPSPTRSPALFRAQTPTPSRSRNRSSKGFRTRSPPAIERSQTPSSATGTQKEDIVEAGYLSDGTDDSASTCDSDGSGGRGRLITTAQTSIRSAKPPLVLLAQWDADLVIKEIFSHALEHTPNHFLHRIRDLLIHVSPKSKQQVEEDLETLVNDIWEGTTAIHYAAAQPGAALEVLLPFARNVDLPDNDGSTPLILAAVRGHCRSVQALLKAGAKVDAVDPWNQTALFAAVDVGAVDVVRTLLEFGADPNISSINGHSPLALATGKNSSEMVELLLEFSADLDAPAFDGKPIPFLASWMGSTDALEILVRHIDVDQVWRNERLIHMACFKGWKGVVDKLIEKHANLNDPPRDLPKASPVALAVESGHSDILRALLAAGAAVECPVKGMSSPLHIAVAAQNLLGCELLLDAGCQVNAEDKDGGTALSIAADLNDLEMVECLVSHGADPNRPDYETPLHIAVDWGNFEMVEIILSSRLFSDIDAKGEKEYTALGIAATTGRLDIVSMLLDHGADPNMRNGPHNSSAPLHIAANKGHQSIVIELLKRGADPYPETTKESSAFHAACIGGWLDVIETFLEVVGDVSELVNFEWGWAGTPLKAAASGGRLDAVKLLLSKGADPNKQLQSKINKGQTIIHAAAEGGNTQVLEVILDAVNDSSLEIRDRAQRTPLWYACMEGHEDMVKYLLERGASTDVIFDDGENIIPTIVSGGSEKNLKLLLEKNPNLDTDCILADGETPLFKAVYCGHGKVVSILLERGADVNRRSKYGNVPVFGAITNRQNETLRILLEHESIDLTQWDSFDRNALQIAQQSGTSLMPAMVLGAAKDSDVETILTENRDMYGLNAYDLTRPEANNPAPFDRCVEGVRRDAQSLLDDFDLHGVRWERLGKFLLQLGSYSFAQIALQRSARAVETTPLVLKHDNYCDMCLDTIAGPRYVCCTCCTVDLCEVCVRRDKKPGNRTWSCDYHSFLAIHLPKIQAPDVMLRTEIDFHVPSRLSPIEEVESETSQGWTEADGNEYFREPPSLLGDEDAQDGVSLSSGGTSNSHKMAIEPISTQSSTAGTGYSFNDGELLDDATNKSSVLANEEWSDRTEDELREFLEAVLKTFTTYQTPNGISNWNFSVDGWTLRYKDDALKSTWVEGDENAKLIQSVREWTPLQPLTEAYYYLSGLSYLMADVPLYLVATGLAFHGGFCFRCVPKQRHELSNLPPPEDWELAKKDAMFILASFYRPMPICLFCRKFSDGGTDCGEHSDFDEDDRQDVTSIDSTDAIMVGKYPQPSTHSFAWEPRPGVVGGMELHSLEDAGVTMDWFIEQLRIEQEWAKLYPYALSPIAESGIMFIMMASAPNDSCDKMKTLILVNKFLNGLVSGSHTDNNKTILIFHPWPQPEFMPNIDPRGSLRPSPLECPKANLQEIFSTFFDHVLWTRATDVHSFKSQIPHDTYDRMRRVYPGKALLSRTLGCHLAVPKACLDISPELVVYGPANDGTDRLQPVTGLKNSQMGSTPAPFINPALLAEEYESRHPYWSPRGQRKPWELPEYYSHHSVEDPVMSQMIMLGHIEHYIDPNKPCWADEISDAGKNDVEWRTQPQHALLRHPLSMVMHTNDGLGPRDTPLNAIIEVPGEAFRMATMESDTISDQFRTLELEDSEEKDNSEMEEDDSEDESDSEMDED
ncbi:ankyrin protein [Fusarium mundagurra]|uniref:Ankyrin protein n=1 Tax=Fusarium mundagurra TaxID=1567541 RepID=A0A8H5YPI8_9HYPO|nr:ankyrin protein [Fusarium mundagurra]